MAKSIITLVKERDAEWNYFYSEYQNGKRINKYSFEQVQKLRKTHMVVVIQIAIETIFDSQIGGKCMNNITQELLTEFQTCRQRVEDISFALYEKAQEVLRWENKNLGTNHEYIDYHLKVDDADCIDFYPDEDHIRFLTYDTWAYGGYEEKGVSIPLYKILSDDWRNAAIKEYLDKLEQERKEKEKAEKEAERKAEEIERAQYERLKKKFG